MNGSEQIHGWSSGSSRVGLAKRLSGRRMTGSLRRARVLPRLRPASLTERLGPAVGIAELTLALVALVAPPPAGAQDAPPAAEGLARDTAVALDTLRVTVGSRTSDLLPIRTRSVEVLGREEIRGLPARTVSDLVGWSVGVDLMPRSPSQADLSLRGAGFEQVLVMVDGVRVSDAQTGHFDLDLAVPLESVERIEILRGPASAAYGADAVGGVVNVVTRSGAAGLSARTAAGSDETFLISAAGGVGGGGSSFDLAGEHTRSDGHQDGRDYRVDVLAANAGMRAGDGRLEAGGGWARRDMGARDFYAPYPSYEETRTLTASLAWEPDTSGLAGGSASSDGDLAGGLDIRPRVSYRRHRDDFVLVRDDPGLYRNLHTSVQGGGEVVARYGRGALRLAAGAEAYRDAIESESLGHRSEYRGALFGELYLPLPVSRPAGVSLGIREDLHETFGSFLSPSVAVFVSPGDEVRLRSSVGRSFRTPTWTERYYEDPANVGRADLGPESSWSGEVGLDWTPIRELEMRVTGFARRSEDLIDWARLEGSAAPWETRNVERATVRGAELDTEIRGFLGARWTLSASLLDMDAEEDAGLVSKYALRPITQRLIVGVDRSFLGRVHLLLRGQVGRWREVGSAGGEDDSFGRLDGRASLEVGAGALYVDVRNVTDRRDPDFTDAINPDRTIFVPGRTLMVGYAWRR